MAGKPPVTPEPREIELEPDAWERFERFIKKAAETPPQHRKSKERSTSRGGVRKGKASS